MSTYRTESFVSAGGVLRHRLVCQDCGKALSRVPEPVAVLGLRARDVLAVWPDLRSAVARHEGRCQGKG
jgi:hypothetical protein